MEDPRRPLVLAFAIPDHPWVDSVDGADVRIAMTVGTSQASGGRLASVESEVATANGIEVELQDRFGLIHPDLRIGANVAAATPLRANLGLSCPGLKLHGAGFIVTPEDAANLGLGSIPGLEKHIRPYLNGRDLTGKPRGVLVIDLFGLTVDEVRDKYPAVYQHVIERVKPERDAKAQTKDGAGYARLWWLHGKPRQELRRALAGLQLYIATVETSKHRFFQFLAPEIAPDNMLVCVATADAAHLGVLSSTVHTTWALAAGGRLGVGNDPRYNKSRCFEPFPFPDIESVGSAGEEGASGSKGGVSLAAIRRIAEMIDAHRKRQQAAYPELTMTGMYNVLERIRASEPLNEKARAIHSQGLVSVLRELHDELDDLVLRAYGWADLLPLLRIAHGNETQELSREEAWREWEESILERLVFLNARRTKDEANGVVHWLRPEFQNADATTIPAQARMTIGAGTPEEIEDAAAGPAASSSKPRAWPKDPIEQVRAVAEVLSSNSAPMAVEDVAARFTSRGAWKKRIEPLLEMLVALGRASEEGGQYRTRN